MTHGSNPHLRRFALSMTCVLLILSGLSSAMNTMHAQTRAYASNISNNTVSVIDTVTNTLIATIPVGVAPFELTITPDGTRAYVTNRVGSVSVIDTATNTVIATVLVGSAPHGVAVTPDGLRVYVANNSSDTVSVIETATNTVIATIGSFFLPNGVAVTPDGLRVYVPNFGNSTVSVIDTITNTTIATIPVGANPIGIAVMPAPATPKTKDDCRDGGYKTFGPPVGPFKNQGQCIKFVMNAP